MNELIMQAISSPWLYLAMFAVAVIDGFFPPVPSEALLVGAAAVLASTGWPALVALGAVAAAGAAVGDNIAFSIGRGLGVRRFRWMRRPRVAASIDWAARALERRGAAMVLAARYVPIGRVAVNMTAGALRYPRRRFVPLAVGACIAWAAYSIIIGVVAGNVAADHPLLGAVVGILITLAVGFVVDRVARARRARRRVASAPVPRYSDRGTSDFTVRGRP